MKAKRDWFETHSEPLFNVAQRRLEAKQRKKELNAGHIGGGETMGGIHSDSSEE